MGTMSELKKKLAEITAQLATCSCDDDAAVFVPQGDESYHYLSGIGHQDGHEVEGGEAYGQGTPAFRSESAADEHGEAFATLLKLRAQKGVVALKHGTWQFLIEAKGDGNRLEVRKRRDAGVKQSRCFSPAFDTADNASRAIDAVGRESIIKAMKVLAWG